MPETAKTSKIYNPRTQRWEQDNHRPKLASLAHIKEAEEALRSLEEGSRTRSGDPSKGEKVRTTRGIVVDFQFSREAYLAEWLQNVYGETLPTQES